MPNPKRKTWVWSNFCFTTNGVKSMFNRPNWVCHEMPNPTPTRGAGEAAMTQGAPVASRQTARFSKLAWVRPPISTKARPESPISAEMGSGNRSSLDWVQMKRPPSGSR